MRIVFVIGGLLAPILALSQTPTRYRATMIGNVGESVSFGKLNENGELCVAFRNTNGTLKSAGIWSKSSGYESFPILPYFGTTYGGPGFITDASFGVLSNNGLALVSGLRFNGFSYDYAPFLYNRSTHQYTLCEYTPVDPATNSFFSIADTGTFTLSSSEPGPIGYRYTSPNSRQVLTSHTGAIFRRLEMNRQGWIMGITASASYATIFDPSGARVRTLFGTGFNRFYGSSVLDEGFATVFARVQSADPYSMYVYDSNGQLSYRISSPLGDVALEGASINHLAGVVDQIGGNSKAVVWSPNTGLQDLQSLVEGLPSGMRLAYGRTPNSKGEMLALGFTGVDDSGPYTLYFLEPVPEPASFLALGVGLAALAKRSRKGQGGRA